MSTIPHFVTANFDGSVSHPISEQPNTSQCSDTLQKRQRSSLDTGHNKAKPIRRPRKQRRKRAPVAGPSYDETPQDPDPNWIDKTEVDTTFGPRPDQLARMITRLCHPCEEEPTPSNHFYRCVASSVYGWAQKSADRQLERIYGHAVKCRALRRWKPELYAAAEAALASMAPGGVDALGNVQAGSTAPGTLSVTHPDQTPTTVLMGLSNPLAQFDPTTNMTLPEQIDHTIARLICQSASPATLVDYSMWHKLLQLVQRIGPQANYTSPGSSYVRHKLIPSEASRAVLHMRDYLATQTNLSLSFDGLTTGEQPVYTIHVCTSDRRTFLYRADVFYGSHNTDYMVDLLEQVVVELGPERVSSIVSDDTNATKKARRLVANRYPLVINLADPVHKMSLCIQDICADNLWSETINRLRKLLTHFKMSTYATGKLNVARKLLGISCGLQSIGRTRFATIYYAATSVLSNLPALYKIYRDHKVDTVSTPLPEVVAEAIDESSVVSMEFKIMLTELVNVLEPLARALLSLESTQSTLADVYFFWLAALATLNQHFASKSSRLSTIDKSRLQSAIYQRFNETINESPTDTYITAFFLDPPIYNDFDMLYSAQRSNTGVSRTNQRLTESQFTRVRKQLFQLLRHELEAAERIPGHPLHQYDALKAKTELTHQLSQYHLGHPPFRHFSASDEGTLQYWQSHRASHLTFILAYLADKIFSVLPNSMCDERTGSRLTHLYSKLRTRMDVHSMTEQIQFSQFNDMVDGTDILKIHRKSRPMLRFQDIPQDNSTEYIAVNDADEQGDEWLDFRRIAETNPVPSLGHAVSGSYGIDITSQLLVSALSLTHGDSFKLVGQSLVSDKLSIEAGARAAYTRAADISWED